VIDDEMRLMVLDMRKEAGHVEAAKVQQQAFEREGGGCGEEVEGY
jgi:hypothetical protein